MLIEQRYAPRFNEEREIFLDRIAEYLKENRIPKHPFEEHKGMIALLENGITVDIRRNLPWVSFYGFFEEKIDQTARLIFEEIEVAFVKLGEYTRG